MIRSPPALPEDTKPEESQLEETSTSQADRTADLEEGESLKTSLTILRLLRPQLLRGELVL